MNEDLKELNPLEDSIDPMFEAQIFSEMSKIEGIAEYFRLCMSRDVALHFNTQADQQDIVKGSYFRIKDFAKKLKKASDKNLTKE